MSWWEALLRIIGAILSLGIVLFLAYIILRWMNKRVPGLQGGGSARLLQVLDRVPAGKNSNIVLLRMQDKVFLVAVSENAIEKLYEWNDPDNEIIPPQNPDTMDFAAALKQAASKTGLLFKDTNSKEEETNTSPENKGGNNA